VFNVVGSSLMLDRAKPCFAFTTGICCTSFAKSWDGKLSNIVSKGKGRSLQERLVDAGPSVVGQDVGRRKTACRT
jgi:hypothetical protein